MSETAEDELPPLGPNVLLAYGHPLVDERPPSPKVIENFNQKFDAGQVKAKIASTLNQR